MNGGIDMTCRIVKLVAIILLIMFFGCAQKGSLSDVSLINKSPYSVLSGSLEVGDQSFKFDNLKPNEEISFNFKPQSDCGYMVQVEFPAGGKLSKQVGYITSGFCYKDKIIISEKDIFLEAREVK